MKTVTIPKLSTPGKIDIARAALANDLPQLAKLIATIPGDPTARGTTKYYATLSFLVRGSKRAIVFFRVCGGGKYEIAILCFF